MPQTATLSSVAGTDQATQSRLLLRTNFFTEPYAHFRLGYRPELDGLRGLAILAVLIHHSAPLQPYIRGGFLGVDLFLVLSGFLITALLVQEHQRTGSINLKHFYIRRMLRLLPALAVVLAACWLFATFWVTPERAHVIKQAMLLTACYGANCYWCFPIGLDILAHTWSLGLEEQFYLLWPFLLTLMLGLRLRRFTMLALVVLGILVAAALRFVLWQFGGPIGFHAAKTSLVTRGDSLLAGCLVALLASWSWLPRWRGWWQFIGWSSAAALLVLCLRAREDAAYFFYGLYTAVAVAGAVLLASLLHAPRGLMQRFLRWPALVGMGRISYGVYLWHFPLLTFVPPVVATLLPPGRRALYLAFLLQIGLSFGIAALSFYWIEQPFLRLKERFTGNRRAQA